MAKELRGDLKDIGPIIKWLQTIVVWAVAIAMITAVWITYKQYTVTRSFNGRFDAHRASTIIENGLSTHIEDPFDIGHYWTKRTLVGINDPKDNVLTYEFGMKEEGVIGEYVINDDFANPKTFQAGVPIELGSLHVRHFFFRLRSDQNRLTAPMYLVVVRKE